MTDLGHMAPFSGLADRLAAANEDAVELAATLAGRGRDEDFPRRWQEVDRRLVFESSIYGHSIAEETMLRILGLRDHALVGVATRNGDGLGEYLLVGPGGPIGGRVLARGDAAALAGLLVGALPARGLECPEEVVAMATRVALVGGLQWLAGAPLGLTVTTAPDGQVIIDLPDDGA